jgi:hypothetical protein
MVLDHLFSSFQPQSLEWTGKSFEQPVAELYTILLEGTSSSCFRDVGGGNLFLTLVSKTGSVMFRSGDCAGQEDAEVHLHVLEAVTEQFQLCKWGHHSEITWIMGCTLLSNLPTYSLAVIGPWRVIMGPTKYCTTILLSKPSQNLPCVSLLKPGIPDCGLPWSSICPGFMVVTPSSAHLTITCEAHIIQFLWKWPASWAFSCAPVALL